MPPKRRAAVAAAKKLFATSARNVRTVVQRATNTSLPKKRKKTICDNIIDHTYQLAEGKLHEALSVYKLEEEPEDEFLLADLAPANELLDFEQQENTEDLNSDAAGDVNEENEGEDSILRMSRLDSMFVDETNGPELRNLDIRPQGSAVLSERDDTPGIIGGEFDLQLFRESLSATFTYGNGEEQFRETYFNRQSEVAILGTKDHPNIASKHYTTSFTEIGIENSPLYKIVMRGDVDAFFDYIVKNLPVRKLSQIEKCRSKCECLRNSHLSLHKAFVLNPLHIAASLNRPSFIIGIIDENSIDLQFQRLLAEHPKANIVKEHYKDLFKSWLNDNAGRCNTTPLQLAAELGEFANVKCILNSTHGLGLLERSRKFLITSPDKRKCYVNGFYFYESLLSRLVESEIFNKLHEGHQKNLVYSLNMPEAPYTLTVAMQKGNMKVMELFETFHAKEEWLSKSWEWIRQSDDGLPPPPSHILAWFGHHEKFLSIDPDKQRALDLNNQSVLPLLLGFQDSEVLNMMMFFRGVRREDIFLFLKEVILTKRRFLLPDALRMATANRDNFVEKATGCEYIYESYGLPNHTVLPLEAAMLRIADMDMVNEIIRHYSKQAFFCLKMVEEDCLRCIRAVQDMAARITDQSRLALILIMLPFVDVFSKRFKSMIHMYAKSTDGTEHLGRHVDKSYALVRAMPYKKRQTYVSFETAMEDARVAVGKWNGSLENRSLVPVLIRKRVVTEAKGNLRKKKGILKSSHIGMNEEVGEEELEEAERDLLKLTLNGTYAGKNYPNRCE